MKHPLFTKYLPHLGFGCGALAFLLTRAYYAFGMDGRGLLLRGHVLGSLGWLPVVAAALYLAFCVLPLEGSDLYEDNFPASFPGAAGSFAAAAGFAATSAAGFLSYPDLLTRLWSIGGILAGLCLAVAGLFRLRGKQPSFLLHAFVCLFLALNLAHRYRTWSGLPQTRDYIFSLFACIFLMLTAYHRAAFEAGIGKRRRFLYCAMMAGVLCFAALGHTDAPLFYLGGGIWSLLNLCPMLPPRHRRKHTAPPSEEPYHEAT